MIFPNVLFLASGMYPLRNQAATVGYGLPIFSAYSVADSIFFFPIPSR